MGWISRFRGFGEAERTDPRDETMIKGAAYDARKAIRSIARNPLPSGYGPDPPVGAEIKRRQLSLVVRYVMAVRAR